MEIKFSGRYTERDFQKGMALMQWRGSKAIGIIATVLLLLQLLMVIFSALFTQGQILTLVAGTIWLFLMLFFLAGFFWWLPMFRARQLMKAPLFRGSITGSASDEALEIHSDVSEGRTRWDAFVQYRMSDEVILLYQNNSAASIIPRSFFASDEDWHDFGKLVQTIVPKKPRQGGTRSRLTWLVIIFVVTYVVVLFLYGYLSGS